mmetsp:Transcript_26423/g.66141  ORF Transcript_26423/g.66141 Transcript_26423/m.66141 type:complete len:220 (+) Transcript_26423:1603-2262(+)
MLVVAQLQRANFQRFGLQRAPMFVVPPLVQINGSLADVFMPRHSKIPSFNGGFLSHEWNGELNRRNFTVFHFNLERTTRHHHLRLEHLVKLGMICVELGSQFGRQNLRMSSKECHTEVRITRDAVLLQFQSTSNIHSHQNDFPKFEHGVEVQQTRQTSFLDIRIILRLVLGFVDIDEIHPHFQLSDFKLLFSHFDQLHFIINDFLVSENISRNMSLFHG